MPKASQRKQKEADSVAVEAAFSLSLSQLRKSLELTQVEVAKLAGTSQARVSSFERRRGHNLASLERYIETLGGRLEVVAVFGNNERFRLKELS